MAQLDKKSIKSLTELCRIDCSEEEQERLLKDLQSILAYVELLQEVDTANVPPCNHVLSDIVNVMRDDIPGKSMPRETFLANAPSHVGGLIRVPPVIKQN
jgi:aspartyl-tRNA(Asn)/glutamyl-tRNA(Gln) amidotransferase subunit C